MPTKRQPRPRDARPHPKRREASQGDLVRVVRECCERASLAMTEHRDEKGVHEVRRAFKRARAVLRLMEDAGQPVAGQLRRLIAQMARKFSKLRDDTVVTLIADKFAKKTEASERAAAVELAKEKAPRPPAAAWWSARKSEFARIEHARLRLEKKELASRDVKASLRRSARRVCKQARRARDDHDIEIAHEWRKRIIVLREQVQVLRPWLGSAADEWHDGLKKLAHRIGVATDSHVFLAAVENYRWPDRFGEAADELIGKTKKKQARALKRAHRYWPKVRRLLRRNF